MLHEQLSGQGSSNVENERTQEIERRIQLPNPQCLVEVFVYMHTSSFFCRVPLHETAPATLNLDQSNKLLAIV